MGTLDWQTVIALMTVIAAAAMMAKRILGWLSGSTKSACHSCPARNASDPPLVQISSQKRVANGER